MPGRIAWRGLRAGDEQRDRGLVDTVSAEGAGAMGKGDAPRILSGSRVAAMRVPMRTELLKKVPGSRDPLARENEGQVTWPLPKWLAKSPPRGNIFYRNDLRQRTE